VGQSVQPVHELAAAGGDHAAAVTAARVVAGIGGSSGEALLAGLQVAAGRHGNVSDRIGTSRM
jgi:hypothetical protein